MRVKVTGTRIQLCNFNSTLKVVFEMCSVSEKSQLRGTFIYRDGEKRWALRTVSERQNFMMHDFTRPGSGCSQLIMEAQTAGLINSEGSTRWTCKSFFSLESSWVWALGFLGTSRFLSCSAIIGQITWLRGDERKRSSAAGYSSFSP